MSKSKEAIDTNPFIWKSVPRIPKNNRKIVVKKLILTNNFIKLY